MADEIKPIRAVTEAKRCDNSYYGRVTAQPREALSTAFGFELVCNDKLPDDVMAVFCDRDTGKILAVVKRK